MKMTVRQFAALTGVSVRTLHYYDAIGLLEPDSVDAQNGYRFYGEAAFARMQEILFYRELDFSLKRIRKLLASPHYDSREALAAQRRLLVLKKERLECIIDAIDRAGKEGTPMDHTAFSRAQLDAYRDEVKARWGGTSAYRESEERNAGAGEEAFAQLRSGMDKILAAFAAAKQSGIRETDDEARKLVQRLQDFITGTQYTCTDEILCCLGEMYVQDERFRTNIDRHGTGTAAYIRGAIRAYCDRTSA